MNNYIKDFKDFLIYNFNEELNSGVDTIISLEEEYNHLKKQKTFIEIIDLKKDEIIYFKAYLKQIHESYNYFVETIINNSISTNMDKILIELEKDIDKQIILASKELDLENLEIERIKAIEVDNENLNDIKFDYLALLGTCAALIEISTWFKYKEKFNNQSRFYILKESLHQKNNRYGDTL
ncbi:MAG: hypothetical protein Q4B52_03735 [Tissierellia bacterium]|nr:hypothetical protein [Tissierellia bacterium]